MPTKTRSKPKLDKASSEDDFALLILLMSECVSPNRLRKMITAAGSPSRLLGAPAQELAEKPGVDLTEVEQVLRQCDQPSLRLRATHELRGIQQHNVKLVTTLDKLFPPLLRTVPEPPLALWMRGTYEPEDVYSLAVLGSSRCTEYGRTQARRFGTALAEHGVTVVNGGERGVDAASLEAALAHGGRVIVALGSGLLNHHRPAHQDLYDSIVRSDQGAIISNVPLQTAPNTVNQVRGDHLVIGSSIASLIVEAGIHSGAMIAARIAFDELDRQVFALPGSVDLPNSAGPLKLIHEKRAAIAIHPAQFLDAVVESSQELAYRIARAYPALKLREGRTADRSPLNLPVTKMQQEALLHLNTARTAEELASTTGCEPTTIRREVYRLALTGIFSRQDGKYDWITPQR